MSRARAAGPPSSSADRGPALSAPQVRVLRYLAACEFASPRTMARVLYPGKSGPASLTRVCEALEGLGLVAQRSTRSPRFGVSGYVWGITADGRAAAEGLHKKNPPEWLAYRDAMP